MHTGIEIKKEKLARALKQFNKLAVALSGGVDSALLLAEAHDILGDRLIAVTARSLIHAEPDFADAATLCAELGIPHWIVDTTEMDQPDFRANTPERCYICKKIVFGRLVARIRESGIVSLAHGANADDLDDYRPGLKAAREMGVAAPLIDAGLTKAEIRTIAKARGLRVWDKPAMACLATRIPYGIPIRVRAIEQVREAERVLGESGIRGCRVRHHGTVARIEVPLEQLPLMISAPVRERVAGQLKRIGFEYVSVDLDGYTPGSMNRVLKPSERQS